MPRSRWARGARRPQQWLTHTSAPKCRLRTAGALTSWCTAPPDRASRCAATPRLLALSRARACRTPAERTAGVALLTAERRKHATYPELRLGGGQRLCVLASGGRWSRDAHELVRQLVRALRAPPALRACASAAWARRWWGMLSVAVQRSAGQRSRSAPAACQRAEHGAHGAKHCALQWTQAVSWCKKKNFSAKDVAKVNEHLTFSS